MQAMRCLVWVVVLCGLLISSAKAQEPEPKRVLMLLADGFNHSEFAWPYGAMRSAGYHVDIAGFARGPVVSGNRNAPDAEANLTLEEVEVDRYFALMIPGGSSPAKLIQSERALAITRTFAERGKPIAAVCHGPLVLMKAGLLRDRAGTALWSVKEEVPELWREGAIGNYLDQPVVIDGNLMTGRHVADLYVFVPRMLEFFESRGGLRLAPGIAKPLVIFPGVSGRTNWEWGMLTRLAGVESVVARNAEQVAQAIKAAGFDAVAVFGGAEALKDALGREEARALARQVEDRKLSLWLSPAAAELMKGFGVSVTGAVVVDDREEVQLAHVLARYRGVRDEVLVRAVDSDRPLAVVVIGEGFDDRVTLMSAGYLKARGFDVLYAAEEAGWKRGNNGVRMEAVGLGDVDRSTVTLVVGPGVTRPEEGNIEESKRIRWMVELHRQGATVLAFGFDSLGMGRTQGFVDGLPVATSAQAIWNFGRGAGRYSEEAAVLTTDRLITSRGLHTMGEALGLLGRELDRQKRSDTGDGQAAGTTADGE